VPNALHRFLERRAAEAQQKALATPTAVAAALSAAKSSSEGSAPDRANPLHAFLTNQQAKENPAAYAEVRRIVRLPTVDGYPQETRDAYQREVVIAEHLERGFRLYDLQCDAVLAYRDHGCLFAPIGVGWGKTLITLLIAGEAFAKGFHRSMLIVPPQVMSQLIRRDLPWARQRVALHGVPFIQVLGSPAKRMAIAGSGRRGCYIMPSSMLSAPNAEDVLQAIAPQLVIGDEAHHLRNPNSARTKRLLRYMNSVAPEVVWLSGTITAKSVLDYLHLVCLMDGLCPLPRKNAIAREWAAVLDSGAEPNERETGPVRPLIEWTLKLPGAPDCPMNGMGFRRAYKHRLLTNPAVVATGDQELGVSLTIAQRRVPLEEGAPGATELRELQQGVDTQWVAPNGDEIDHAFHKFRWLFELSAGIFNDLFWPAPEVLAARRDISEAGASALLHKAKEHHEHLQEFRKTLRSWLLSHHIKGLDTPFLVAGDMARHQGANVGLELYESWRSVKDLEDATPDLPVRDSRIVRVCDYKIRFAEAWAREHQKGIIWYHNAGVGQWLAERLPDALFCPAGRPHDAAIIDPETANRIVIASISAHGTGKNLQHHSDQLFVQWPRPAATAEQVLGRLHRVGQMADELVVNIACDLPIAREGPAAFDELLYAAMLQDALYIHQTTGSRQKVIYANYETLPRIFPSAVLEERGFELTHRLDASQQKTLTERFSNA